MTILPGSHEQVRDAAETLIKMNMSDMISGHGKAGKQATGAAKLAMHSMMIAGALRRGPGDFAVGHAGASAHLQQLTASAREIASGKLDLSVPVRSQDEVGRLAQAFNDMAAQLRVFKRIDHERPGSHASALHGNSRIDSLPDAVVVDGPVGKIELTNQTAKRLFSLDPDVNVSELPTTWLADLHHRAVTDLTPRHLAGWLKACDEGEG